METRLRLRVNVDLFEDGTVDVNWNAPSSVAGAIAAGGAAAMNAAFAVDYVRSLIWEGVPGTNGLAAPVVGPGHDKAYNDGQEENR